MRFSAVERRQLRAAPVPVRAHRPGAPLFTSTAFGEPGYGQLLEAADRAIAGGPAGVTITAGAESGSEMGAFSSGLAPIKENGLLIKYGEYMPLGPDTGGRPCHLSPSATRGARRHDTQKGEVRGGQRPRTQSATTRAATGVG